MTTSGGSIFTESEYLESVDSTNEYLKRYVAGGQERLVVASAQTAGKGRHGRSWHSPPGGLYVSYLLFPEWYADQAPVLNQVASLSVVSSISEVGIGRERIRVKPPNDVLIDGRKVSGILVELGSLQARIQWAIVGIGVNLLQKEFPESGFRLPPTSLRMEGVEVPSVRGFGETLTSRFERFFRDAKAGKIELIENEYSTWIKL